MGKIRLIETKDGSHTLFMDEFDEPYHSTFGAIQESKHVFIDAGLSNFKENKFLKVFEMGLGTGLNALLTAIYAFENDIKIEYWAVEAYPPDENLIKKLNYPSLINHPSSDEIFQKIHSSVHGELVEIDQGFIFKKILNKVEQTELPESYFDLVYFDAFNPDVQPELWTEPIFQELYNSMNNGAVLTTYSCKGIVKRALKSVGFRIEKIPGPEGKREMLRATKNCG